MNQKHQGGGHPRDGSPVNFFKEMRKTHSFDQLFNEGMELVEEAAEYLSCDYQETPQKPAAETSVAYTNESLHLTNRLMQTASWLLAQRAGSRGEIDPERALLEKLRITIPPDYRVCSRNTWNTLPSRFRSIVYRSIHLQQRILHIEQQSDSHAIHDEPNRTLEQGKLISFPGAKERLNDN